MLLILCVDIIPRIWGYHTTIITWSGHITFNWITSVAVNIVVLKNRGIIGNGAAGLSTIVIVTINCISWGYLE